jgi:predicted RNA-binding Zn-ribbon protein involved in translation (DUF1610 family)
MPSSSLTQPPAPVPRSLRLGSFLLSTMLMFLFVWLLGFVLDDIGDIEGPSYSAVEERHVDQTLSARSQDLGSQIAAIEAGVLRQEEIQQELRQSMDNAQRTMDRMIDLHRLAFEQQLPPDDEDRRTLAQAQQRYVEAEDRYESANRQIAASSESRFTLRQELQDLEATIAEQRLPARDEHRQLFESHRIKIASYKLSIIVPLFLAAAWVFSRNRQSPFRSILLAALAATFWKVGRVMFDEFPREIFKYIAIVAAITIVLAFLTWLLRKAARPDKALLVTRYREAYASHVCPVCAHPVARGPLRFAVWTRKGPRLPGAGDAAVLGDEAPRTPYSCPSCGTTLFNMCESCGASRHSLLPYCEGCGAESAAGPLSATA